MSEALHVVAISRARQAVCMSDGLLVPVTNWIDAEGDEGTPEEALVAVAGPDSSGKWWVITLSEFGGPLH